MFRRIKLYCGVIVCMAIFLYTGVVNVYAATHFEWIPEQTMSKEFILLQGAGQNDMLFYLDAPNGEHKLEYYIGNGTKTTVTLGVDDAKELVIKYQETTSDGAGGITTIADDDKYKYLKDIDYATDEKKMTDTLSSFNIEKPDAADTNTWYLKFEPIDVRTNNLKGVGFQVNNQTIYIHWIPGVTNPADGSVTTSIYYYVDLSKQSGLLDGNFTRFEMTQEGKATEVLYAFKDFDDYEVKPIHLIKDGAVNKSKDPITQAKSDVGVAGTQAGLEISFSQPRQWDDRTWKYTVSKNTSPASSAVYQDLNAKLPVKLTIDEYNNNTGKQLVADIPLQDEKDSTITTKESNKVDVKIGSVPQSAVYYTYDDVKKIYRIRITKDTTSLAKEGQENFDPAKPAYDVIDWDIIKGSTLYDIELNVTDFTVGGITYETRADYKPISEFGYTFLDYKFIRENLEEASLRVTPYNFRDKNITTEYYLLYDNGAVTSFDYSTLALTDVGIEKLQLIHNQKGSTDPFNIPAIFKSNADNSYKILVKRTDITSTEYPSQILHTKADNADISPSAPQITSVAPVIVVPNQSGAGPVQKKVQFDLEWEAMETSVMDGIIDGVGTDKLYYELLYSQYPDRDFKVMRVYEITKDAGGKYAANVFPASAETDIPSVNAAEGYVNGYAIASDRFKMETVVPYVGGNWTFEYNTVETDNVAPTDDTYTATKTANSLDINVPGVVFLKMRTIMINNGVISSSDVDKSAPFPVSLDATRVKIPIVSNANYKSVLEPNADPAKVKVGVNILWDSVNMKEYKEEILTPDGRVIKRNIADTDGDGIGDDGYATEALQYRMYIASKKEDLNTITDDVSGYVNLGQVGLDNKAGKTSITKANIEQIRAGKVAYIDVLDRNYAGKGKIEVEVLGLEENSEYYVKFKVFVPIHDGSGYITTANGEESSTLDILSPKLPDDIDDTDEIPTAPLKVEAIFENRDTNSVRVKWDLPVGVQFGKEAYGFEVFVIEGQALTSEQLDKKKSLETLKEGITNRAIEAWKIYYDQGTSKVVLDQHVSGATYQRINQTPGAIGEPSAFIIDNNNAPNKVLYYYVRTTNIGVDKATSKVVTHSHSEWIPAAITTEPISSPYNLIVDYQYKITSTTDPYNPNNERIIRVDLPLDKTAVLESDYFVEIHMKSEDDAEFKQLIRNKPVSGNDPYYTVLKDDRTNDAYIRMHYRIRGLKSGTEYQIKVRLRDQSGGGETIPAELNNGTATTVYPLSAFSNTVRTRTAFNQEDFDKDNALIDFIAYYEKKASEIKQLAYYHFNISPTKSMVKYREEYGDGEVIRSENGTYTLFASNKNENIYYIPSKVIDSANDFNVTLLIENKNQKITLYPYSIGKTVTDEIKEVIHKIQEYSSKTEDYYIKIKVGLLERKSLVMKSQPSSPLVTFEISVVGSKITEDEMDDALIKTLDKAIETNKEEVKVRLQKEIDDKGINEVRLTYIVQDVVAIVKTNYSFEGYRNFTSQLEDTEKKLTKLNKDFVLGLTPKVEDSTNVIYRQVDNGFVQEKNVFYNEIHHITTDVLGSYISAAIPYSTTLTDMYSQDQRDVLNKYMLQEVFSSTDLLIASTEVKASQMIRTMARLLGAKKSYDTVDFLRAKGIEVPNISGTDTVNKEEAYYTYIQTFAAKNNIELKNVNISDYHIIEDIDEITESYREIMLKGVNLGIVETNLNMIEPKKTVTTEEFINMIDNIEQ